MLAFLKSLFLSKATNIKIERSAALIALVVVFSLFLVFGLAVSIEILMFSKGIIFGLVGNICISMLIIVYIIVYLQIIKSQEKK